MPKDWALILKGDSGDLNSFGVKSLTFARAPGHCSGHVVYNHKPSGYMLAGDFTDIIQGEDGSYKMHTMCNKSTCNITLAHETICRCADSPQPHYSIRSHVCNGLGIRGLLASTNGNAWTSPAVMALQEMRRGLRSVLQLITLP